MITVVIESDYETYFSVLTVWSDWFFLVLRAYQIIHCSLQTKSLQTKTNKKCVLWQRNRTMLL